ncbi:MAG: hypothetical protein ACTSQN_05295, partial [Candidatus Heimdallarchaeota archaeon]
MKLKNGKIFVILLVLCFGLFFVPKGIKTQALLEETHVIVYDDYVEANVGATDFDEFLWIHYTQNNSDVLLEIVIMDHSEYNNFLQYGSGTNVTSGPMSGNFTDYLMFGTEGIIWHLLIFNADFILQRTTEINLYLEKGDFYQNDGGSGYDAGGYFASALYLEEENFFSSGKLFFGDTIDFYKFYAEEGDHLSININGLRFGNTSFILYAPNGFREMVTADYITQDLEINIPANYSGYWIMKFYKDDFD